MRHTASYLPTVNTQNGLLKRILLAYYDVLGGNAI